MGPPDAVVYCPFSTTCLHWGQDLPRSGPIAASHDVTPLSARLPPRAAAPGSTALPHPAHGRRGARAHDDARAAPRTRAQPAADAPPEVGLIRFAPCAGS